jgi:hypothetical protein
VPAALAALAALAVLVALAALAALAALPPPLRGEPLDQDAQWPPSTQ